MVAAASPATRVLVKRMATATRPRPRISTPKWCESNIRLPKETSAKPGRYNLKRYPFWREPLSCVDDPEIVTITLMCSTQIGKTTLLRAMLACLAVNRPAPAMIVAPDKDDCLRWRDDFYRLGDETRALRHLLGKLRNNRWIDFGAMLCHLAWSGSAQRMGGKSCKYVFATEIDNWRQPKRLGRSLRLIAERVKAFFRHLIVYESTPSDDSSAIADLYDASDRRTFHVPCPHCGLHQELRFFPHKEGPHTGRGGVVGYQRETGEYLTQDEALEAAYYLCLNGCRIDSEDKADMVAKGVWCPKGQTVNRRGEIEGSPDRPPTNVGFHLSSIYAEEISFGRIAQEYLQSREDQKELQAFWNNWLALRWVNRAKAPKWQRLARRLAGNYRRGKVPSSAFFLTAGVDVQDNAVYWIVRAWGERVTSWLVDWGKCNVRLNSEGRPIQFSDLNQLDDLILDRRFPLVQANAVGATWLPVRLANIDYQGHRSWEVADWVRSRQHKGPDRLRTIAGDVRVPAGEYWRSSTIEKHAGTGKPYPGGLVRWAIDVDSYKSDIIQRYEAPLDQPGAWFLPENILEDDGRDYLKQVCNEGRQEVTKKGGRKKWEWKEIDGRVGNHYWDDEVYARCAADMVTGMDWTDLAKQIERELAVSKPPESNQPVGAGVAARDFNDFSAR